MTDRIAEIRALTREVLDSAQSARHPIDDTWAEHCDHLLAEVERLQAELAQVQEHSRALEADWSRAAAERDAMRAELEGYKLAYEREHQHTQYNASLDDDRNDLRAELANTATALDVANHALGLWAPKVRDMRELLRAVVDNPDHYLGNSIRKHIRAALAETEG